MSSNDREARVSPREPAPGAGADGPAGVQKILYGVVAACALLLLADPLIEKHPYFEVEHWWGFHGLAGLGACVLVVLVAWVLRRIVMRGEDYYDR